jgi:hypothetical protein
MGRIISSKPVTWIQSRTGRLKVAQIGLAELIALPIKGDAGPCRSISIIRRLFDVIDDNGWHRLFALLPLKT